MRPQSRPLGAESARWRCRAGAPGVAVEPVSCGVMDSVPPRGGGRGRAASSTFALMGRTGKRNLRRRRDGDVWGATSGGRVHMYGARVRPVLPPHPPCGPAET